MILSCLVTRSALIDAFYANLNQQMSKAEALRQAQIALITGDLTAFGSSHHQKLGGNTA